MKFFSSNKDLVDAWFYGTNVQGQSASMSYKDRTLYTYATPLARWMNTPTNKIIHLNMEKYSHTSSMHVELVQAKASNLTLVMPVDESFF